MIDISQWRASIGLWYYQICDNVIDKSLPALCRKGTRAIKRSNEKHSQNSTTVERISSNEIPQSRANRRKRYSNPVVSNGQTVPVASTNGQTPVLFSDDQKPVALPSSQTPVLSTDGQTPWPVASSDGIALSSGQTSVSSTNGQKPVASIDATVALSKGQKPVPSTDIQTPVASSNGIALSSGQTSVASTNGQKPVVSTDAVALSKGQKPVVLSNGQKPVVLSNGQKPVVLINSSTANTTMRYADWCGRVQTISLAVFLFLLLILSGDIELNPGPKTGK